MELQHIILLTVAHISFQCLNGCFNGYDGAPTFLNCQYRCHCKNDEQCDAHTGYCVNGCECGWLGPGCQYRNIAKYKIKTWNDGATNISTDYAASAVDGNNQTCSKTKPSVRLGKQSWSIEWGKDYLVIGIALKLHEADLSNFRKFRVETKTGSVDSRFNTICYQHPDVPGSVDMEKMCQEPTRTRQLHVILNIPDIPLRLCEVAIYGGCWGDDCEHECGNCSQQPCNADTGECSGGCDGPWKPPMCSQGCGNNTYGISCTKSCGNCKNASQCDLNSGDCREGCEDGWIAPRCTMSIRISTKRGLSYTIGVIVGASGVFVVGGLALAVCCIIIRGRKRKTERREMNENNFNASNDVYETTEASRYDKLDHSQTDNGQGIYYTDLRVYENEDVIY